MNRKVIDSMGAGKAGLKSHMTGFVLSVVLTVFAFGLALHIPALPSRTVQIMILAAALVQMMVHLICFLHLDASAAMRWNVLALLFTAMIMFLFVGGTLWIMFNLNSRMM
jgi:cytochrome o ubiquinol oxidase operon protein cyoD